MLMSEEQQREIQLERLIKARERQKLEIRKKQLQDKQKCLNHNLQNIYQEVTDFSAGAIKFSSNESEKYIPLFPHYYCRDVQQRAPGGCARDNASESQEEKKETDGAEGSGSEKNSLSDYKLEEIAPAADVTACFFGDKTNPDGSHRYNKL